MADAGVREHRVLNDGNVDARGDAASGHDVAVVDDPVLADPGVRHVPERQERGIRRPQRPGRPDQLVGTDSVEAVDPRNGGFRRSCPLFRADAV